MEISATRAVGLEISCGLEGQRGFVRRSKVGRTTDEPGDVLCEHVQDLPGGLPPGQSLGISREHRKVAIPACGQFTTLHQVDLGSQFGELVSISGEKLFPLSPGLLTTSADPGSKIRIDAVWHEKLCVLWPAIVALGKANFVLA